MKLASGVVSAGASGRTFEPYKMNGSTTDKEWVIDAGNDWFLIFHPDDVTIARIRHRNGDREALSALAGWVAYRWRAKVLHPEVVAG